MACNASTDSDLSLNEIIDFGFIEMVEISKNQYSSNIIAIVENTKAYTKAHTTKYTLQGTHNKSHTTKHKQQNTTTTKHTKKYNKSHGQEQANTRT